MTSKERMLIAMSGGTPDRVPASPDTNWLIPAKLTGRPFWDVYLHGDPPIWKAYNDSVKHFGIDGFSHHGVIDIPDLPRVTRRNEIIEKNDERILLRRHFLCPEGKLYTDILYPHNQTPANIKNPIEDMEKQFGCLRYMQGDYEHASFDTYRLTREDMGEHGVVGLCLSLPTLMLEMRQPNEAMFYDYYDYPELIGKWMQMQLDKSISLAKQIIDSNLKPDFVFFPMSGLLTLQSEEIVRKYSYPALKTLTRMFKEAGILTSLHSCGKEYLTVEYAASETDLDCIDPLEVSPMGDCSLSDLKRKFGKRIALKGNLHTTEVMLRMKPDGVAKAARQCLDDAMAGGGFILSTGDQCGRDTPLENITTLVEVCEKYGKY